MPFALGTRPRPGLTVRPLCYAYAMTITEIGLWDSEFNTVFTYAADCSLGCGCDFEVVGTYRDDYCVMCT